MYHGKLIAQVRVDGTGEARRGSSSVQRPSSSRRGCWQGGMRIETTLRQPRVDFTLDKKFLEQLFARCFKQRIWPLKLSRCRYHAADRKSNSWPH